jgi:hypothetical protein
MDETHCMMSSTLVLNQMKSGERVRASLQGFATSCVIEPLNLSNQACISVRKDGLHWILNLAVQTKAERLLNTAILASAEV